jgi:hypothetical protein
MMVPVLPAGIDPVMFGEVFEGFRRGETTATRQFLEQAVGCKLPSTWNAIDFFGVRVLWGRAVIFGIPVDVFYDPMLDVTRAVPY